jgi:hypothetical protein
MLGLRTLRFFTGALVVTLVATGNGEMVMTAARTTLSAAQGALGMAENFAKGENTAGSTEGENIITKASKAVVSHLEQDNAQVEHGDAHDDEFAFTRYDGDVPVRWCAAEIRILVNEASAPAGAVRDFREAAARISTASGIRLNIVGTTDLIADRTSHLRAGDPYPEVLISWARPAQSNLLIPGASGVAVANPAQTDAGMRIVTGALVFNRDHDVLYKAGFGKGMTRGNLYQHELSHLIGLGHVEGGELMAATIGPDTADGLTTGDRAGLKAAGSC